jgi:FixJ family two-component response regulator
MLDEGINFIQKPFSMQAFAAKVREALDKIAS